ncbi:MAG: Tetratricopeptide [Bacteroidota bacterium]|nr:Tetratricopeptide [Bacteroidota bacterium]
MNTQCLVVKKVRTGNLYRYCYLMLFCFVLSSQFTFAKSDPVLDFAKQQITQKFYTPAISTLNSYIETHPKSAEALYWKGYAFARIDNPLAAEENFLAAIKLNGKYLPAYEELANMFMKKEKYSSALTYYNGALALKDSDVNLLNSRGMCFYYLEKFELAIKDFKEVIKLDPGNYLAYNNRGSAEYNNQDIATASIQDLRLAEKDFNKSLQLKPDFELAYRNRGIVRYYMDSLTTSYKDLLYAIQLEPTDEKAHYYLAKLFFKQKSYNIAMQFYDNAIKMVNYKPEMFLDRGLCKLEMGDYKSARADFYKSMGLSNNTGIAEYHTARSFAAEDNKNDAIYALREAKKVGLFVNTKYFADIAKDKYFAKYAKDKVFNDAIKELKFGKF